LAAIPGIVSPLAEIDTACRFAARCDFAWGACREQLPRWLDLTDVHYVRCHLWDKSVEGGHALAAPTLHNSHGVFLQTTTEKTPLLVVDQLKMYFPVQKGLFKRRVAWIKAVDGISFTLQAGRTLALIGESGSGKTTAGFGITQLLKPYAGEVHYRGINLAKASSAEWLKVRHFMQMIFQDPYSSLNPRMRVGDILAEGIDALGLIKDSDARHERISQLLQQVGLPESSQDRYPHEFSGGQRQRIAIARALAVQPELIICDEPTSALDISVQAQILNLLRQLQSDLGLAYLFITHNIAVVSYMADDVAVMYRGQIVEQGTVEDVLKKPKHPYTKALLAAVTN
jgi:peptide/nickel transport system ATP-binding protein